MAKVTIGSATFTVALSNFKMLKRAWKYLAKVIDTQDPMDSVDAILALVAIGATGGQPADWPADEAARIDWMEENLTPAQVNDLQDFVTQLLIDSGIKKEASPDEPVPLGQTEGQTNPSTETSTPLSTSLSPPAAAA